MIREVQCAELNCTNKATHVIELVGETGADAGRKFFCEDHAPKEGAKIEPAGPTLLRIPRSLRSVDEVLGVARKLALPNILVLAEHENGNLTILDSELTAAQANWLLDRAKSALLGPAPVHTDDVDR